MKLAGFLPDDAFQDMKNTVDFIRRTVPVFCGKSVESYVANARRFKVIEDGAYILDTCPVPFQAWQAAPKCSVPIRLINDGTTCNEDRRGAVGDIAYALDHTDGDPDVLVIGGDNIFAFDLQPLLDSYNRYGNSIVIRDVKSPDLARLYATVELTPEGQVTAMVEKPENPATTLASLCIYAYGTSVRQRVRQYAESGHGMDTTGEFASWMCTVEPVFGCALEGTWFDIGDMESLENARKAFGAEG